MPDWRFPHDVDGWLTEPEGRELATLAAGKIVLEIGSYCGRSSICMAQTAKSVICVDPFDGRDTPKPGATWEAFKANVIRYADVATSHIGVVIGLSWDARRAGKLPPVVDMAFIDGAHDYFSVLTDADICLDRLTPGWPICFHDYASDVDPFVRKAVDGLIGAKRMRLIRVVDSLAVCERC